MEKILARDVGIHVGKGGMGPSSKAGSYAGAKAFLAKARKSGEQFDAPRVVVGADGKPFIDDGRHRWAMLKDSGFRMIPIAVPRNQAAKLLAKYGG